MSEIRLTLVASTLALGGSERVMRSLFLRLPGHGFRLQLLLLRDPGPIGEELLAAGVPGSSRLARWSCDPLCLLRLIGCMRRFRPHIVLCLDHRNAMFWGRLAALLAGVPKRVVASHTTRRFGGGKSFGAAERLLMGMTDRVIALSQSHARHLIAEEGIAAEKVAVVENGVDVALFTRRGAGELSALRKRFGLSGREKVVVMVAGMRPEKAHEVLLAAMVEVRRALPGTVLLLVGGGPGKERVERLVAEWGLEEAVMLLGERGDVAELLGLADLAVLPSHPYVETLPLAILEAMAAGVPVVASSVGSIPELIEDGVTGRLVPPGDSKRLAEVIIAMLADEKAGKAMADRARIKVEQRYSLERMICRYATLFSSLLEPAN